MAGTPPIYRQIADEIRQSITDRLVKPGDKLPTVRQVASRWGVARETVAKAFKELADEGLIVSLPGRGGTMVAPVGAPLTIAVALDSSQQLRVASVDIVEADQTVAASLSVATGTSILLVKLTATTA